MLKTLYGRVLRRVSNKAWGEAFVGGDFDGVGAEFFGHFKNAGLQPHHDVLDVGCGIGRMAVPLEGFLTGRYLGFDVSARAIGMCRERFHHGKFHFIHADLYNATYNLSGAKASEYRFPCDDRSFDFVIATSVFTHLLPDEASNYLGEIARVLRPDGTCLVTWFVMESVETPAFTLERFDDVCCVKNPSSPSDAVAYEPGYVAALYEGHNLQMRMLPGTWARRRGVSYQDIIIATHRRQEV